MQHHPHHQPCSGRPHSPHGLFEPRLKTAQWVELEEQGPSGWQTWAEPVPGSYVWAVSFSPSVPQDLVAVFAASLSSAAPVRRRLLPESKRNLLLRAPAG
ncbi:DUF317 domain-containing protein [Streptomyces shenzhenensis]|uniref:DUF317 domain-containing protein n=1 Tax=Streptomyces shenzhenensis TaxID=943815 RepID=A0A3M0I9L9_9ACTN|nr:hypothetical protein CTZ28_24265 [Streptomyces shenzhenensis]